ncbi:MAG: aldo/keto reductase [Isosphaeraceae bacterium]
MEIRPFGKTDMKVSVLGFGGAEIGSEKVTPEVVSRLLNEAIDQGLNVIDTAECYYSSEELIGQTMAGRRDEYYLFTKCGHAEGPSKPDWRPESLTGSIERSLKRLKTDRVDLIHLHSCSEAELRKGDVIDVLCRAKEKGQTRYIGYSGDGQAAKFAIECGAFDSLQTSVNIADQEAIDLTLPLARDRQLGVIAKRPLANVAWRYTETPKNVYHQPYWERLQTLKYPFLKGGDLPSSVPLALRFTLSVPGVDTAIVGTTKPGRWQENAASLEAGPLPDHDFEAIRVQWCEVAEPAWIGQT